MAKKILIICDAITPPAYVPRVINLCKHLNHNEWDTTIVCEKYPYTNFETKICKLHQIPYYTTTHGIKRIFLWILHTIFQYKDIKILRYIKQHLNPAKYDIILCSTFNLHPLTAASRLAKQYNIPLIIDLRDIAEQWGTKEYFNIKLNSKLLNNLITKTLENINISRRNRALKQACAITTISTWHLQFLKQFNSNCHLIYNGYDSEIFHHESLITTTFDITYTGRIYDLKFRSPHLLMQAIHELDIEGKIDPQTVKIKWYIDNESHTSIKLLAEKYNILEYTNINSYVTTNEIPHILNQSSINLILTNKSNINGPHGIMTTKFYESLGVEKPILCVQSDEGCLAAAIQHTQSGIAATTVCETKTFILDWYTKWQTNHTTHLEPKNKNIFIRQNQAQQFAKLFKNSLNN